MNFPKILAPIIISFLVTPILKADEEPFDPAQILLKSDLIVYGKVHRDEGKIFRVRVHEVWKGKKKYGLEPGDFLKILNEVELSCGLSLNGVADEIDTAIFFLRKEPNIWRLMNRSFIPQFFFWKAEIWFNGCSFKSDLPDWRREIKAFLKEFSIDSEGIITSRHQESEFANLDLPKMAHDYYLQLYPSLREEFQPRLDCEQTSVLEYSEPKTQEDTTIYVITEQPATPPIPLDSLVRMGSAYLQKSNPEFFDLGIEGRIYISLIIEKDGSISKVHLLRGLLPQLDKAAIDFFQNSSSWIPAMHRRRPVRFKMNLPVLYQRK